MAKEKKTIDTSKVLDEAKQVEDVTGNPEGTPIVASRSRKKYYFRPVPLAGIPKLAKNISAIQEFFGDKDLANLGENEVIKAYQGESAEGEDDIAEDGVLYKMAQIIKLGIDYGGSEKRVEDILEEFSLGDFPKCLKITFDMNDFLAGMKSMMVERIKDM